MASNSGTYTGQHSGGSSRPHNERQGEPGHVPSPPGTKSKRRDAFERATDRAKGAARNAALAAGDAAEAAGGAFHRLSQLPKLASDLSKGVAGIFQDYGENKPGQVSQHLENMAHDLGRRSGFLVGEADLNLPEEIRRKRRVERGKSIAAIGATTAGGALLLGGAYFASNPSRSGEVAVVAPTAHVSVESPPPPTLDRDNPRFVERAPIQEIPKPQNTVAQPTQKKELPPEGIQTTKDGDIYNIYIPTGQLVEFLSSHNPNSFRGSNLHYDTLTHKLVAYNNESPVDDNVRNIFKEGAVNNSPETNVKKITITSQRDPEHPILDELADRSFVFASKDKEEDLKARRTVKNICDIIDAVSNLEDNFMRQGEISDDGLRREIKSTVVDLMQRLNDNATSFKANLETDTLGSDYNLANTMKSTSSNLTRDRGRTSDEIATFSTEIAQFIAESPEIDAAPSNTVVNLNPIISNPNSYPPLKIALEVASRAADFVIGQSVAPNNEKRRSR